MRHRTRLLRAARGGDTEGVEALLAAGADPEAKTWRGFTALMQAARRGHAETAAALLAAGADPNRRSTLRFAACPNRGITPLMAVCQGSKGGRDVVVTLARAGADVDAADDNGTPPLLEASLALRFEIAGALIETGADVDQDWGGVPIITVLAEVGWSLFVELLLRAGADPNLADPDRRTPLMAAARQGEVEAALLLLTFGADRLAQDAKGRSAAWYARRAPWRRRRQVLELLDL